MRIAVLCSWATLGLWSCLSAEPPIVAPDSAQSARVKPLKTPLAIDINNLFRHWLRSSEEEPPGDSVQVFRPAGSMRFPPSRFRMAYKFARNGICEWYYLSPDDAHRFKEGKWRIEASDSTLLQITEDGRTTIYRIVGLSRAVLRLMPLNPEQDR